MAIQLVEFFPEWQLVRMNGNALIGVISITEPGRKAPIQGKWGALLRLAFHDKDTTKYTEEEIQEVEASEKYVLFNQAHARQILDWLKKNEDSIKAVYVHCAMGVSRSAAVAIFIAEKYGLTINKGKAWGYNRHVYRVLYDEWTKDPDVQQKILDEREL